MTDLAPTIYSKGPGCQPCKVTEAAFHARGITPDVVSIATAEGQAAIGRLPANSPLQAPVVVYGSMIWSGMRPDLIEEVAADVTQRRRETSAGAASYASSAA